MNHINLLEILKNQIDYDTYIRIQSDFMIEYNEIYKNIRPCKSTQEKAIKKYISAATLKDEKTATYTKGGTTCLLLKRDRTEAEPENLKKIDLAEKITAMFKNRRPAECYFFDSIALYRALKKQQKQDYFLHIAGHYYNAALIAEMLECIADNKERYIQAEICENGALLIRQKYAALILPVNVTTCHPSKNVNMQDFLKYCDGIDKYILSKELKATA